MKGLLLKDYYMILKYCRMYGLIVLVFVTCSLVDQSNLFMLAYPAVLCGINCVRCCPMMSGVNGSSIVKRFHIQENRL